MNDSLTDQTYHPDGKAGLFIVVMGVAGSGKTTIGRLLAARLDGEVDGVEERGMLERLIQAETSPD